MLFLTVGYILSFKDISQESTEKEAAWLYRMYLAGSKFHLMGVPKTDLSGKLI